MELVEDVQHVAILYLVLSQGLDVLLQDAILNHLRIKVEYKIVAPNLLIKGKVQIKIVALSLLLKIKVNKDLNLKAVVAG